MRRRAVWHAAGAHEPVAVAGWVAQGMEQGVAAEAPVQDDHRVVGERVPYPAGQREFAGAGGPQGRGRQQMMAQAEERDHAHLRIARARPVGAGRAAEGRDILGRIGHAQRGAVETVDR